MTMLEYVEEGDYVSWKEELMHFIQVCLIFFQISS